MKFVRLDQADLQVAGLGVQELNRHVAGVGEIAGDGILLNAADARRGALRVALAKGGDDLTTGLFVEFSHPVR